MTTSADLTDRALPAPPWERLRERLLACADELDAAGDPSSAGLLRATLDEWWDEQRRWNDEAVRTLSLHHEINNALVGVSGNVQILLMGQAGQQANVRERLEVVLRESQRISAAAAHLLRLRTALDPGDTRAAAPTRALGEVA